MRRLASRSRSAGSRGIGALGGALVIQPALGVFEPLLAAGMRRDLRRQLVAAAITEALVLFNVDRAGVLDHLAGQARTARGRAEDLPERVLVARRSARSSRNRACSAPRSRDTRCPPRTRARSPASSTGSRARRRRGSTRPSSPDQTLAGCAHRLDRRHKRFQPHRLDGPEHEPREVDFRPANRARGTQPTAARTTSATTSTARR